ncbi:MAG TPA: hypothetical protein VIH37_00435 [Candidatus Limnocylindrales bacterium]
MNDLVVFIVLVAAMAGIGLAFGMILAGRIDRRSAPRSAEPPPAEEEQQP